MIRNEKGVALMMVLLIATITLAVTTTMLYMLTQSTRYSGLQKRLVSASEAAIAGSTTAVDFVSAKGADTAMIAAFAANINLVVPDTTCLETKVSKPMDEWGSCSSTMVIDPDTPATYDFSATFGTYDVYSKITWSKPGNTGMVNLETQYLRNPCVVHCDERLETPGVPGTYSVEIDSRNSRNPNESAKLSVLFQF